QRHAVTHFFHQVILHQGATGVVKSIQARLFCHIGEPRPRGQYWLPQLVIGKDGNNEARTGQTLAQPLAPGEEAGFALGHVSSTQWSIWSRACRSFSMI